MKILVLWSCLSDYMVACFRELSIEYKVQVFWVYQPVKSNAPFSPFDLSFCSGSYEDLTKSAEDISEAIRYFEPDIIFMAAWNFSQYMTLSKSYKKAGKTVISSFDNQWKGSLKQYIGILTSNFFLKPVIDNFIVPSERQASFAKKLGYHEPLQGFYCANSKNFESIKSEIEFTSFVFVGRFVEDKSVKELIEAYQLYRQIVNQPWTLRMIGKGPLESICKDQEGVIVEGFSQPDKLPEKLAGNSCFILPSKFENWGLVIHEAALVGLPIICSSTCGASTWFVRDGQSGFLCIPEVESIKNAMLRIHYCTNEQLKSMANISYDLGNLWTTKRWASHIYHSFNSILSS